MIGAAGPRLRPSGLAARIILFLSLALVPIGVVAYFQTAKLQEETRLRSQLSLVALTEAAALGERETILRAQGGAQALGATFASYFGNRETCMDRLRTYLDASPGYSFAGFLTVDGDMPCHTGAGPVDVENNPRLQRLLESPGATAWLNQFGPVSRRSVLVVAQPFFEDGQLAGHVLVSVPSALLPRGTQAAQPPAGFEDVVTINERGQVMSSRSGLENIEGRLPADLDLRSLIGAESQSFAARSRDGTTRVYASAPLVPGMVHALGIWEQDSAEAQAITVSGIAKALPFLMWAASVIVAFLAVNRLVIRHIKRLSRRMRAFARSRRIPVPNETDRMPAELADIENDFLDMADAILRDEAQQENALREKTVLLKEVHHRVKNNLQLISSIMNMQIRQSDSAETRAILHRLQDRVRSLATIHRNLYQTEDLGHVDAGRLLEDLVRQMGEMTEVNGSKVTIETEVDSVETVPDQAVPLSLLAAEAMTNALKYAGPGPDEEARVKLRFARLEGHRAEMMVTNTVGPRPEGEKAEVEPRGLGARLIRAFATQLGGELDQQEEEGRYTLGVRFALVDFTPDESTPTKVPNVPDF
ncbi:sensor histidine kinase [Salipiger mucosus]|uniref:histidine kinase n=1 Tax=Salipiger mucosus DSM 16094 TaxID=1123237 RepID=S9QZG2_9RHOB|nr:sensor histidine kinase [Salipiger mucosus]EPX85058.1 sensor histidine kinase, putative [Salipiger mucosus DSM 16094]